MARRNVQDLGELPKVGLKTLGGRGPSGPSGPQRKDGVFFGGKDCCGVFFFGLLVWKRFFVGLIKEAVLSGFVHFCCLSDHLKNLQCSQGKQTFM